MEKNINTKLDYYLAIGVVVEAALLYFCLTQRLSIIGYILPVMVAIVSVIITGLSFRDFFSHINKK